MLIMRRRFMGVRMGGMCRMMSSVRIVRVELREMLMGAGRRGRRTVLTGQMDAEVAS